RHDLLRDIDKSEARLRELGQDPRSWEPLIYMDQAMRDAIARLRAKDIVDSRGPLTATILMGGTLRRRPTALLEELGAYRLTASEARERAARAATALLAQCDSAHNYTAGAGTANQLKREKKAVGEARRYARFLQLLQDGIKARKHERDARS